MLNTMPKYNKAMAKAADVEAARTELTTTAFDMSSGSKHLAIREKLKTRADAAALATHVRSNRPC
jgi:hypothetical protein